ncbi:MAG: ABC transporter ATP-binding protein [Betaproteobacteria bacterium]|nr:ABC transporter ATP-binding protein [Betaproteobacteria bacterium]
MLHGVSLKVDQGEMVAIIGPNGAGKSTMLNCISGLIGVTRGSIRLEGSDITNAAAFRISRAGLLQVPEGRQILGDLTVLENLQLGVTAQHGRKPTHDLKRIYQLFPILEERNQQRAGSLSGGQQQMLAIGRSLMGAPRLLLLDEPSLGLSPMLAKQVLSALRELNRDDGLTILLVEQNARAALHSTRHGYVLEQGRVVHEGPSADLAKDPDVISHYLGQADKKRAAA